MDDRRIKQFFKFDESDLSANRNGRLSEKQARRLVAEARAERKSARESAGILLVVAVLGLGFGLLIVMNASVVAGEILIGLLLCVLWPLAWGWKAWQAWISVPAGDEQVRTVRGRVRIIRDQEDIVLEVEEHQFDLEKDPGGVIAPDDEIIVFYLERTEDILSVEVL
jgi:hypothetical protein